MPVVNLPQDTRWGDLGKGLGQVLGAVGGSLGQLKVQTGVAELMQDPSISDADKGVQALKKFGDAGYKVYQETVNTALKQAQVKNVLAEAGLSTVQSRLKEQQLPYEDKLAAARARLTALEGDATKQKTTEGATLLPGKVAQQGAQTGLTTAETGKTVADTTASTELLPFKKDQAGAQTTLTGAEAAKTGQETDLIKLKVDQAKKFQRLSAEGVSGDASIDALARGMGIPGDSPIVAAAKAHLSSDPDPMKGQQNAINELTKFATSQSAAKIRNEGVAAPQDIRKTAASASEAAFSAKQFLDAFDAGGYKDVGTLTGGPLKAMLERWGIASGDMNLVQMWNASKQQIASQASSGQGFGGEWRVKLAQDTTEGIKESPLHSIMALGEIAGRMKSNLETQLSGLTTEPQKAPIEKALKEVDEIYQRTHSLQGYTVPSGGGEKSVVLYNGNQVDPKTFKPLMQGSESFDVGQGHTMTASALFPKAQQARLTPQEALAKIRANYGWKQ